MSQLARIAAQICNTPLLVLPETAETVYAVIAERMHVGDGDVTELNRHVGKPAGPRRDDGSTEYMYRLEGESGIALLPVMGELVNRGSWLDAMSGLTSYERLDAQLNAAINDPRVKGLVLDMNSPGGQASGAMETADLVRALSKRKPIVAFVNGQAASAAYAIAAGSTRVVVTPSAIVGSIGVVYLHMDRSAAVEKAGLKPTLLHAGAYKIDGSPFAALPDDARTRIQASIDGVYDLFVATVAKHRKGLDAAAVRATEGGVFMGQAAVDARLADAVGTLDDAFTFIKTRGKQMSDEQNALLATARTEARAEGHAEGLKAGISGERSRINAILSHDNAKGREKLAAHLAFATDMSAESAHAMLAEAPKAEVQAAAPDAPATPRLVPDHKVDAVDQAGGATAAGVLTPEQLAARVSGKN
jgi:signal peptide peptidase SppA